MKGPAPGDVAAVAVGGTAGTAARWATTAALDPARGWPTGTLVVNLVGAFLLGLLLERLARGGPDEGARRRVRLLGGTGFCGAFTTYSSLAVQTDVLAAGGAVGGALAYAAVSLVAGLTAASAGARLGGRTGRGSGRPGG